MNLSALDPFRKRQSPRTGFVHLFAADESATDTIPIYENFLFSFALFQQKTVESVTQGKELLERLLAFQNESGNFPIYIHDFPRCWDYLLPLKIAPVCIHLLRIFGSVLGGELKDKLEGSLQKMIQFPLKKTTPLWEQRTRAIQNLPLEPLDTAHFTAQEWAEWIITCQLADPTQDLFPIPYDPELQLFLGTGELQEKGEPHPWAIEWMLAGDPLTSRLNRDHVQKIYAALFFPFNTSHPQHQEPVAKPHFGPNPRFCHRSSVRPQIAYDHQDMSICGQRESTPKSSNLCKKASFATGSEGSFRRCWKGKTVHSLAAFGCQKEGDQLWFDLPEGVEIGRELLFEAALYCDISPDTELFIEGKKGTVFRLGDQVSIRSSEKEFTLCFTLEEGEGLFCGHILRANRPTQIAKGYEAYDWQIAIRTLRRSGRCLLKCSVTEVDRAERIENVSL